MNTEQRREKVNKHIKLNVTCTLEQLAGSKTHWKLNFPLTSKGATALQHYLVYFVHTYKESLEGKDCHSSNCSALLPIVLECPSV